MNNGQFLELERFCDPTRPGLEQPFSHGTWSYATNGHVLVRIPRRDDVAENPAAPAIDASQFFERVRKPRYEPAPKLEVSEPPFEWEEQRECDRCGGSGRSHLCPDCKCKCPGCDGTGKVAFRNFSRVSKYIALLQSLPNLELGPPRKNTPLAFRFDGGEGLLMPCSPNDW